MERPFIQFKRGITREVILIGKLALKFPSVRTYPLFLTGILCNIQERKFWKQLKSELMCPVLFKSPLGLIIVMPRCADPELKNRQATRAIFRKCKDEFIPVECKPCSFGKYKGKLVAVDYGS